MLRHTRAAYCALFSLPLITLACGGSTSPGLSSQTPGTLGSHPDGSGQFFTDAHRHGLGSQLRLAELRWGRLVDVFGHDQDGERVLMQSDYLVSGALVSDGGSLILDTNPITGQASLTVARNVDDESPGGGRSQFFEMLRALDANLTLVPDAGAGGAGHFSMLPRNATIMLRFDDLIDPSSVDATTVRIATGILGGEVFEGRILMDRNHGGTHDHDGDGQVEFYPTRILVDPAVSELEAFAHDPVLPINNTGFPASTDSSQSNIAVRLPSQTYPAGGQTRLLQNPSGHRLAPTGNGTIDLESPTADIMRVARSGGLQDVTGDPFNGFLPDMTPPRVIGTLKGFINQPPQQINPEGNGLEFLLPSVTFASRFCSQALSAGDVLRQDSLVAEVLEATQAPQDGILENVRVRLRTVPSGFSEPGDWMFVGAGEMTILSPYDPVADAGQEGCFVEIFPAPTGGLESPTTGVGRDSIFTFRFSEPMEPSSVSAFDSMRLTRVQSPTGSSDWTVGEVSASIDLFAFSFLPMVPLAHEFGEVESYFLSIATDGQPPTDLVGNAVAAALPDIEIRMQADDATSRNGGRVLRFDRVDEDLPVGDVANGEDVMPEFFGQHFYDLTRGAIRPRAVTRFEAVIDRTQPAGRHQTALAGGVQEPLSPLGCKLQMAWRSIDTAYDMEDSTRFNLDVEGLNWTPIGIPATDHFNEFEIRLAHSRFLPDEYICATLLFPTSGLVHPFRDNLLSQIEDPQRILHPRSSGYSIRPGDLFTASTGTRMMPFPMNEGLAPEDRLTYTWRDTAIPTRGGEVSAGAPTFTELNQRNVDFNGCTPLVEQAPLVYPPPTSGADPVNIRSIALPLLVEFRCFPDDGASGLNSLDVSLAQVFSPDPGFRAHSTGGLTAGGYERRVNPELEPTARGGLNPAGGQPTRPTDNVIYSGSMDLVVRVSRSHSVWFLANNPLTQAPFANPRFAPPIVEPRNAEQPAGTQVKLAFRGATAVGGAERSSAALLDAYGDHYSSQFHSTESANSSIGFLGGDQSWHEPSSASTNPVGIDGAQFYQVRITFLSNVISGARPELSNLAVAWHD